jgi:hypothetical protein
MPNPLGRKNASAHFDLQAAEHFRKAAQFAALADGASRPVSRAQYRTRATQENKAGMKALKAAKTLNSK